MTLILLGILSCQGKHKEKKKEIEVVSEMETGIMKPKIALMRVEDTRYSDEKKQDFEKFVEKFRRRISLLINDIEKLGPNDTINVHWVNNIIIRNEKERPKYIDKNGEYKVIEEFYGLYQEAP